MSQEVRPEILMWISQNRGVMTRIAGQVKPKVSAQFIHQIVHGRRHSKTGKIERLLREAGAPI